jgi:methionine-S-sulfoxide reductase
MTKPKEVPRTSFDAGNYPHLAPLSQAKENKGDKMSFWKTLLGMTVIGTAGMGCSAQAQPQIKDAAIPKDAKTLVVAGGCFWCVEVILEELKGVYAVESGYAGGSKAGVTYDQVLSGNTGHAEAVKVFYDPKKVSAEDLLRVFMATHDPTTLNRQGPDSGTQYRSAIFYTNDEEKARAQKIIKEMGGYYKDPIVTTVEPLKNYTRAEEYHQNYFAKYEKATDAQRSKMNAGYCAAIIEPKVRKFRDKYLKMLKKGS